MGASDEGRDHRVLVVRNSHHQEAVGGSGVLIGHRYHGSRQAENPGASTGRSGGLIIEHHVLNGRGVRGIGNSAPTRGRSRPVHQRLVNEKILRKIEYTHQHEYESDKDQSSLDEYIAAAALLSWLRNIILHLILLNMAPRFQDRDK